MTKRMTMLLVCRFIGSPMMFAQTPPGPTPTVTGCPWQQSCDSDCFGIGSLGAG
jgi:hypothetical protein